MRLNPRARATDRRELCGQLIMNAAFVAYETQKAKAQKAWLDADKNRRIIYVFDTDLIKTWCAPWSVGPVDPITLGSGYGQVLPPQMIADADPNKRQDILVSERTQAEAVAWLLASRALGAAFSNGTPILLTGAHFSETMTVYQQVKQLASVHDEVTTKGVNARLDLQLASALRAVRNNLESKDLGPFNARNAGAIIGGILRVIDLRDATRSHGAVREWDAFKDIVRIGNGLFKLLEFRPDNGALGGDVAEKWRLLSEAVAKGEGATDIDALKAAIMPVVGRAKSILRPGQSDIDAVSVAEVAYMNDRLRAQNVDLRIVLMTGDRGLSLALANAGNVTLPGTNVTVSDFAFGHVRHLWSFVDLVQENANDGAKPQELFSGLLAFEDEHKDEGDFRRFLLENAADPERAYVNRIRETEIEDAYDRWEIYTKKAADTQKHYLFDDLKRNKISEIILAKFRSINNALGETALFSIVNETTARARDLANVEFSGIGANSLLDRHKNGIRNPPELMFDSLRITDGIFKDLALPKRVFLTAEDFAARFDQIAWDCHRPDPQDSHDDDFRQECYLKYLVLGALFASANRWIVAEQHAESAVRIIERAKALNDPIRVKQTEAREPKSHMSGREGYFLLASSKRVRAHTDLQFKKAQDVLNTARDCLIEDRKEGTARNVPFIRFDCEALAIALGRYYSARQRASSSTLSSDYDPCDDHVDVIYRCVESLRAAQEAMRRADDHPETVRGDQLASLPVGTKTSIATNLIQVFVISEFRKSRKYEGKVAVPIDRWVICEAIDTLASHSDLFLKLSVDGFLPKDGFPAIQASIICSPLMLLYAVVGDLLLGAGKMRVFRKEADVDRVFDHYKSLVTHYDEWRFGELQKFVKSLLKGRRT
jgi:hypothetical protein